MILINKNQRVIMTAQVAINKKKKRLGRHDSH
jgi:hypothetical protein